MLSFLLLIFLAAADKEPAAIKDFHERVDKYVKLHDQVDGKLDPVDESASPSVLLQQRKHFAMMLQKARPNARRGDFFTARVRPYFLKVIKEKVSGPEGEQARKMILGEGNPKGKEPDVAPQLKVNAIYPTASPVTTMPPSLLLALPQIPEEVEYRFVGRHLILRDVKSELIVDILFEAMP